MAQQDIATQNIEYRLNDAVTLDNKVREERSVLNYLGTIPEQAAAPKGCGGVAGAYTNLMGPISTWTTCLNPQSRYQVTDVLADEFLATTKFFSGPVEHTLVTGALISREQVSIDSYTGLTSEAIGGGSPSGSVLASILAPPNEALFTNTPTVTGNPNVIPVNTKSVYGLETANYQDYLIFTAGLRFDQTDISASKIGFPTVSAIFGHVELQSRPRLQADPDRAAYMPPMALAPSRSGPSLTERRPTMAASIHVTDQSDFQPGRE